MWLGYTNLTLDMSWRMCVCIGIQGVLWPRSQCSWYRLWIHQPDQYRKMNEKPQTCRVPAPTSPCHLPSTPMPFQAPRTFVQKLIDLWFFITQHHSAFVFVFFLSYLLMAWEMSNEIFRVEQSNCNWLRLDEDGWAVASKEGSHTNGWFLKQAIHGINTQREAVKTSSPVLLLFLLLNWPWAVISALCLLEN